MKKILSISSFLIMLFIVSCDNKSEFFDQPALSQNNDLCYKGNTRSIEEALAIAEESLPLLNDKPYTRSIYKERTINQKDYHVISNYLTRSNTDNALDTLMYIFNFDNNQGFAVISANRSTEGLLAITESGHYDPSQKTGVDGFDYFMELAKEYVQNRGDSIGGQIHPGFPISQYIIEKDTLTSIVRTPKLTVNWGQSGIFGAECPNGISGCVNTAAGMIMSYFQYPTQIYLTYSNAPVSLQTLDWDDILLYQDIYHPYASTSGQQAIGRLLRELGNRNGSVYHTSPTNETSASIVDMRSVFSELNFNVGSIVSYSSHPIYNTLTNNNIILMRGGKEGENVGHAWVVDGCKYYRIKYTEKSVNMITLEEIILNTYIITINVNHINWGWDGHCNGYFSGNVFNPSIGYNYDNSNLSHDYNVNYSEDQRYFTIAR